MTPSRTPTRTATPVTPSRTPTNTPPGPTKTPTPTPIVLPLGRFPVGSVLPAIANWLSPAIRGLLAMAPPPPPLPPPATPCVGIPAATTADQILCGECVYDSTKLCAFLDLNGDGEPDATPLPHDDRGFDDPQADPDPTLILRRSFQIRYRRADLFDLGAGLGIYQADDVLTGNPPWGSQPLVPDNDADGVLDPGTLTDRHNQGMYAAIFDGDVPRQRDQQFPNDAFGEISCPFPPLGNPCDVYGQDCGGISKHTVAAPSGYNPYPVAAAPPGAADWPVVPFPRDWIPSDTPSAPVIKRLLRFASSVVSYDSTAAHMSEYRLEENARNVVVSAPGTPLAGALHDAYNYFVNAVFPLTDDPAVNCRNYVIVLVTDGAEECFGNPCAGGPTGKGPAGDLGALLLPSVPASSPGPPPVPGARELAHAADSSVPVDAIPVFVVAMGLDPNDPRLTCIADNSSSTTDITRKGRVFGVTNRTDLQNALQSILNFKRNENSFAAPSVPGFASGLGSDTAQIGAVIPSHKNEDGSLSQWSIWSGSLKSYRLDSNGTIPVVSAATATPGVGTPTPTPSTFGTGGYPDESDPNNANPFDRKPDLERRARARLHRPGGGPIAERGACRTVPAEGSGDHRVAGAQDGLGHRHQRPEGPPGLRLPGRNLRERARHRLRPDSGRRRGRAPREAHGGLPARRHDDQRKPRRSPEPAERRAAAPGRRAAPRRAAEVLLLLPGRGASSGRAATGPDRRRGRSEGVRPQARRHLPLRAADARAAAVFPVHLVQPERLPDVRESAQVPPEGADRRRQRRIRAHLRRGRLRPRRRRHLRRHVGPRARAARSRRTLRRRIMAGNFPALLNLPPRPQYFMDGSMGKADAFIDPVNNGTPTPGQRVWRSVVVGGLRQGGNYMWALDVTQPDKVDVNGLKIAAKDNSPDCLDGGGGGCGPGGIATRKYPEILWEMTDNVIPRMGQTWSRPTLGRIRVLDGSVVKDKYVAIFGGGFDPNFRPGDSIVIADQVCPPSCPARPATRGRALYIVDIETGAILSKLTSGDDSAVGAVNFAPVPAPPGRRGLRRRRSTSTSPTSATSTGGCGESTSRRTRPPTAASATTATRRARTCRATTRSSCTTPRRSTARRRRASRSSRSSRIRPSSTSAAACVRRSASRSARATARSSPGPTRRSSASTTCSTPTRRRRSTKETCATSRRPEA